MLRRIISFAFASVMLFASAALDLPIKSVGGKSYYYYRVQPSETLFSLSRKLGISQDDIVKFNPAVADGLKANSTLYFPTAYFDSLVPAPVATDVAVDPQPTQEPPVAITESTSSATANSGYSSLNRPKKEVNAGNPGSTAAVQVEEPQTPNSIVPAPAAPAASEPTGTVSHVIQRGETLFGLAYRYSTTVKAILDANPGLDSKYYQAGKTILIPTGKKVDASSDSAGTAPAADSTAASVSESLTPAPGSSTDDDGDDNTGVEPDSLVAVVEEAPDTLVIAVMLPFQLAEDEQSKATQRYMEFYRGFLLAADSLSHNGDPVLIRAIDSAVSPEDFSAILADSTMADVDVFLGSDDTAQLSAIADVARENDARLFNIFAVRDDSYLSNPAVIQANIPHTAMYDRAISHFLRTYQDYTPVFISRIDGAADKIAFTDSLRSRLKDAGRSFKEINFRGVLTRDDLSSLSPSESYVFIPVTGQRSEFTKFAPALREFRLESPATSPVSVFGYPEWVTFRDSTYDLLCDINSTIYARYYTDPDDYRARRVTRSFNRWFDTPMADAFPSQGLLGFDVATFIIRALRDNKGDFSEPATPYSGIQCDFRFVSPQTSESDENAGLVNSALYIINFRPGGIVDRLTL